MKLTVKIATVLFMALSLLSGCATKTSVGPDYYLLSASELSSQSVDLKPFTLALGPIDVPVHLDREGIATHDGDNQLNYSDSYRWAEPLNENLTKTLHSNFAQLLPNQQLIEFPYRQANKPDYQLAISIEKFGYVSDGSVVLKARSVITDANGQQLDSQYINLKQPQPEKIYSQIVKTMSDMLGEMASLLANKLTEKV